jgi:hypothetical protein
VTGFTAADVTLSNGDLPFNITNGIIVSTRNAISLTNAVTETNKLKLTITKSTGVISGSFDNPAGKNQTIKVNGVIFQDQTNVSGYFLESNQSGAFSITPR